MTLYTNTPIGLHPPHVTEYERSLWALYRMHRADWRHWRWTLTDIDAVAHWSEAKDAATDARSCALMALGRIRQHRRNLGRMNDAEAREAVEGT